MAAVGIILELKGRIKRLIEEIDIIITMYDFMLQVDKANLKSGNIRGYSVKSIKISDKYRKSVQFFIDKY